MNHSYNYRAEAQRLVDQHKARDFSHACSLLAQRRRKAQPTITQPAPKIRLPYSEN